MSWIRWWMACVVATVGALLVGLAAGDFDSEKREVTRRAQIDQAARTSGVSVSTSP